MNQSHRGSSRRHPKGAPPPAARTLLVLALYDRALDQACGRLPTPNTNTVHSRQATSIQYHLIGLNEKTNLKQKKPSRRNGRLSGHEEIVSNSISAQACLPADRPSTVHRKYSGRDRSSLCLFMDSLHGMLVSPARRRIAIGLDRRGVAPAALKYVVRSGRQTDLALAATPLGPAPRY